MKKLAFALLAITPFVVSAQGLFDYIPSVIDFFNDSLIPFILGVAFLVVVFNTARFFILGSTNPEGREQAKSYMLYSILAFVIILTFWGIINLLVAGTGLGGEDALRPDYLDVHD